MTFHEKEFATVYRLMDNNSTPYENTFAFYATFGSHCSSSAQSHY